MQQCTGKQLKAILVRLREVYPDTATLIPHLAKTLNLDKEVTRRGIAYALDYGWVCFTGGRRDLGVGPVRLTAHGIDKLNNWADEDDELII
jgi:hypothetical protein